MFTFYVRGVPVPQGSKSAAVIRGRAVMFEANKKHKAWRELVTRHAMSVKEDTAVPMILEAAELQLIFYMPRPKTVKRLYPTPKPDLSKLIRSVEDSLVTAGLIIDDAYIVNVNASKRYADATHPEGVFVSLSQVC